MGKIEYNKTNTNFLLDNSIFSSDQSKSLGWNFEFWHSHSWDVQLKHGNRFRYRMSWTYKYQRSSAKWNYQLQSHAIRSSTKWNCQIEFGCYSFRESIRDTCSRDPIVNQIKSSSISHQQSSSVSWSTYRSRSSTVEKKVKMKFLLLLTSFNLIKAAQER